MTSVVLVNPSDPRDASKQMPFHLPPTDPFWQPSDAPLGQFGMISSGSSMVLKNRLFAWPSVFLAAYTFVNDKPLRTKEGSSGGLQAFGFALAALLTVYFPSFLMVHTPSPQPAA